MRRVLLVGVDPLVLQVMKSTLDRNGFEVDTAIDLQAASDLFVEQQHDAIVIDGDCPILGAPLRRYVLERRSARQPLVLLACEATDNPIDCVDGLSCESLVRPLSLRYLVARLNEYFGVYPGVQNAA